MNDIRYFNIPIQLLEGFMTDKNKVLNNIFDYSIYVKTLEFKMGKKLDKISGAGKYYFTIIGNPEKTYANGKLLYDEIPFDNPKVGINKDTWFEYYQNDKTEFEKVCLLAFLALKSILGTKDYCKTVNNFWLARMDGKRNSIKKPSDLSNDLLKYASEYQTVKIKNILCDEWGMKTYSRYTRGFYFSFSLSLDELVLVAEKSRKSVKKKKRVRSEQEALTKALLRIKETPISILNEFHQYPN